MSHAIVNTNTSLLSTNVVAVDSFGTWLSSFCYQLSLLGCWHGVFTLCNVMRILFISLGVVANFPSIMYFMSRMCKFGHFSFYFNGAHFRLPSWIDTIVLHTVVMINEDIEYKLDTLISRP